MLLHKVLFFRILGYCAMFKSYLSSKKIISTHAVTVTCRDMWHIITNYYIHKYMYWPSSGVIDWIFSKIIKKIGKIGKISIEEIQVLMTFKCFLSLKKATKILGSLTKMHSSVSWFRWYIFKIHYKKMCYIPCWE